MQAPTDRKAYITPTLSAHGTVIGKTEGGLLHPPIEQDGTWMGF